MDGIAEAMIRVRRALHEQPELSNQEFKATETIEAELAKVGLSGRRTGETGLVVDVPGDEAGGIVALRADMDALPIDEETDLPFRSRTEGVMHACGHDVHAAMLLGAVLSAIEFPDRPGTIRAIFQPAEENEPLGARAVISGGHLAGVDSVMALHVDPALDTGQVALLIGPMMAASDVFSITLAGRSSHAGWPHVGADAIAAAAMVIVQAQTIISRRIDPRARAVVSFGRICGGVANNVVADRVQIDGVIRTLDEELRPGLREMLRETVDHACRAVGVRGEVDITPGEPVLYNDANVATVLREASEMVLGREAVRELSQPTMNGEDFAFYGEVVPVAMAWIGVRNEKLGFTYPLHHPRFAVDEAALPLGAAILREAAMIRLREIGRDTRERKPQ